MRAASPLVRLLLLPLWLCALCVPAWPWAMKTHVWVADQILADLEDGTLTVYETTDGPAGSRVLTESPLCLVSPPDDVVEAIRAHPSDFRAGCCGPDAFPDIYYGQSIIHAYYPGKPWRAVDYARHLLECARECDGEECERALAFAYGFLCHEACDALGHTWVNGHTGGAWDWGNMDLVKSHIALEGFVNSRLPAVDLGGGELGTDVHGHFVARTLIRDDRVSESVVHAAHLQALVDYRDLFDRGVSQIDRLLDKTWGVDLSCGALKSMRSALRAQRQVADDAMAAWIGTSNAVGQEVLSGNVLLVPGHVSDWTGEWLPRLLGVPGSVLTALEYLGWPMQAVTDWLTERFLELLQSFYEATLASTLEPLLDPETWYRDTQPIDEQVLIESEMGLDAGAESLDPERFGPLWDSVQLSKLVLLDGAGVQPVGDALGVTIPWAGSDDNLLYDSVCSLDASHQLSLYPTFRLLSTPELAEGAYRRLFLTPPYAAAESAIDPAHLWVYEAEEGQLTFLAPVPDPGAEGGRVVGYVYRDAETGDERVPWFEEAIPSYGEPGLYLDSLRGTYDPAAGREGRYHLATAAGLQGSNELAEDAGVDVSVSRAWPWRGNASGGQATPPPGGATQAEMLANLLDSMRDAADMLEQAGQTEMAAQLRERIGQLERGEDPDADGSDAAWEGSEEEPWTYPSEVTSFLRELLAEGAVGDPDATPADLDLGMAIDTRWAVGAVRDGAGNPIPRANVTLVARPIYDELRAAVGVPHVKLDEWLPEARYLFGRSNSAGDVFFAFVAEGDYVVIASAPHFGKSETELSVAFTEQRGVLLPDVTLTTEPGAAATGGTAAPPTGQDVFAPSIQVMLSSPWANWDAADERGEAEIGVDLRALGGFSGDVVLTLDGLPDGMEAEFVPSTMALSDVSSAILRLRSGPQCIAGGVATVVASGEGLVASAPLVVALGLGRLEPETREVAVRAGEQTRFRIAYEGSGQAPQVTVEEVPRGISLRTAALRQNPDVEPLDVLSLTVDGAREASDALRPQLPLIASEPPELIAVTPEEVRAAPERALGQGVLLAPGGWIDVIVEVVPGQESGRYPVELVLRYGERYVVRESLTVVVEP